MTKFYNEELQRIYDENIQFGLERMEKLNGISKDIKALEELLTENAVPVIKVTFRGASLSWQVNDKKIYFHAGEIEPVRFIETKAHIRLEYGFLLIDLLREAVKRG